MGTATNGFDERLNVVAVGASAEGVEALTDLAAGMPPDLPCAVLVVLHIPPGSPSAMARILDRSGSPTAVGAADHPPLRAGIIYLAEPDRHLLVRSTAGTGRRYEKYSAIADEADHALTVLGTRLGQAYRDEGARGTC